MKSCVWIDAAVPLRVQFRDKLIDMDPGHPVGFSLHEAKKLLNRAAGKLRVAVKGELVGMGSSIMWKSRRRTIGPGVIEAMALSETGLWVLVSSRRTYRWVHERVIKTCKGRDLPRGGRRRRGRRP